MGGHEFLHWSKICITGPLGNWGLILTLQFGIVIWLRHWNAVLYESTWERAIRISCGRRPWESMDLLRCWSDTRGINLAPRHCTFRFTIYVCVFYIRFTIHLLLNSYCMLKFGQQERTKNRAIFLKPFHVFMRRCCQI